MAGTEVLVLGHPKPSVCRSIEKNTRCTFCSLQSFREKMEREQPVLVVLWSPDVPDPIESANRIASAFSVFVLLFVETDILEQAATLCRDHSVFVLSLSSGEIMTSQALNLILKARQMEVRLQKDLRKERQKLQDAKLLSQAKLVLIEKMHFSEQQAHSYIQKKAMDHSMSLREVSSLIIERIQKQK